MDSVWRFWAELYDTAMNKRLLFLVVYFCICVAKPNCQEKVLRQLVGYRCVTASEVYDQIFNTQSHLCRHQCIGQDGCSVANYDVAMGTCLLTQEKCIDMVTDLSFELTHFGSMTRDECLRWAPISEFDNTKAITSERCNGDPSFPQCYVGRLLSPPNILPSKFQPSVPVQMGQIWTVLNGAQANNAGQENAGEVLHVHQECNVLWKPFNALVDSLPEDSTRGGYLESSDSVLFIMRAEDPNGFTVFGYYDPVAHRGYLEQSGVLAYVQMEILFVL